MKVAHIGIAVNDVVKAEDLFVNKLGLVRVSYEELSSMKLKICKVASENVVIELIEPMAGETTISKFLKKRGEGIHHISFEVEDVNKVCQKLTEKGLETAWPEAKQGSGNSMVNFLHPKNTYGVLIEFSQSRRADKKKS